VYGRPLPRVVAQSGDMAGQIPRTSPGAAPSWRCSYDSNFTISVDFPQPELVFNAAGKAQHLVVNRRPRNSVLVLSRAMFERFAGTPLAKHWEGTP